MSNVSTAIHGNVTQSDLTISINRFSQQIIYFHLFVYAQGILGGLSGFLFLLKLRKPFVKYNYPPTVRMWFLHLTFTDIVSLLGYSYLAFYNLRTRPNDDFTMFVDLLTTISDIFNVLIQVGVSLERVLVFKWQLKSRHVVTQRCIKKCLLVFAIFSVINATASVIARWRVKGVAHFAWVFTNLILLIIFVLLMTISSIWILILLRQNSQERQSMLNDVLRVSYNLSLALSETNVKRRRMRHINREVYISLRLLCANVVFIVSFIPIFALGSLRAILAVRRSPQFKLIDVLQQVFTPIMRYNNALNWIPIYLCNKKFRQYFNPLNPCS